MNQNNHDEFRCVINQEDLEFILANAQIGEINFVQDQYTGAKRIRRKNNNMEEKDYPTEVTGTTYRFGAAIDLPEIQGPTFLEFKHTNSGFSRWEIEFEGEIHEKFKNRENIRGWQILIDQGK